MLLRRLKVNRLLIAAMILAMMPGLAALVSSATGAGATTGGVSARSGAAAGAELGVGGLILGNSAASKRLLSAAIILAAGPTARRHVAISKTRRERKRDITETVKCVEITYQRLPRRKAKEKIQDSFRLSQLTPRFLRRSAGLFALVADRSPLNFLYAS